MYIQGVKCTLGLHFVDIKLQNSKLASGEIPIWIPVSKQMIFLICLKIGLEQLLIQCQQNMVPKYTCHPVHKCKCDRIKRVLIPTQIVPLKQPCPKRGPCGPYQNNRNVTMFVRILSPVNTPDNKIASFESNSFCLINCMNLAICLT